MPIKRRSDSRERGFLGSLLSDAFGVAQLIELVSLHFPNPRFSYKAPWISSRSEAGKARFRSETFISPPLFLALWRYVSSPIYGTPFTKKRAGFVPVPDKGAARGVRRKCSPAMKSPCSCYDRACFGKFLLGKKSVKFRADAVKNFRKMFFVHKEVQFIDIYHNFFPFLVFLEPLVVKGIQSA